MVAPSGAKATAVTKPVWPVSWRSSAPVRVSQIRAVPSSLAVAMVAPSGAKATALTASVWPVSWRSSAPVRVSQIRAVRVAARGGDGGAVGREGHRPITCRCGR